MTDETRDPQEIQRQIAYYRRRLDELAGENLKLDYQISGLRKEVKQKRQAFMLLSQLQQTIGAPKQISEIFATTILAINATLGMDRTVVLTPTEREDCYQPTQWTGFTGEGRGDEFAQRMSRTVLRFPREFAQGTGLLLVKRNTQPTPLIAELRLAFELPYFVCVPVIVESRPIGLLLSGRLKEAGSLFPPMDQGEVTTFQALAGLISASVENMRLGVLQETDRLKTAFFANVSHEFRTPITLTLGPLEQILAGRHGAVPDVMRDQLRMMLRNQERLLILINQILDLSKLEAGRVPLTATPLPDVNQFVEERAAQFRASAERRGLTLRLALDPRLRHADLVVDHEKIDRLLYNLLSNAVKFTREGTIEISTALHQGTLRLTIADTGIGIKEDQLPYIFDRFRQADGGEARGYAGTGLGLALVKEIVLLHGGQVIAHSQFGTGSSFRVSIPLGTAHLPPASVVERAEEGAGAGLPAHGAVEVHEGATAVEGVAHLNEAAARAFDPARPTILYAEDNPDLRTYVRDLLAADYNVFLAVDGCDGVEKAGRYRPDLILSDSMMPRMSGRELLRALRDDAELGAMPVIFLTARAGAAARTESLDAGADDYVAKPFDDGELLARVRNVLRVHAQEHKLVELNQQLATASRHKSEFLANMSHELRTPLNAVIGFSEVLLEQMFGAVNDKQMDYLHDIRSAGRHLLALINDILDLSKVEAGRMEVEATRFALSEVLEQSLTMVRERASQHGILLSVAVDPAIPLVEADERKVKQILFNLLSNAVKFTPDGGQVELAAALTGEAVQVTVRDTGVGIAPADQGRIFKEFQQAGHRVPTQQEGTGLGLALAKRFVEMHGGQIVVESQVGTGSTFAFSLPLRQPPARGVAAEGPLGQGPGAGMIGL